MKRHLTARLSIVALVATGLLQAPMATAHADTTTTTTTAGGLGLDLDSITPVEHTVTTGTMGASPLGADDVPAAASLGDHALPAGDQGRVNSCVAWATGYTAYGILMSEQNISGAPMAPMFTYAQIVRGNDVGTNAGVALKMQQAQGIDTRAHYSKGDYDFTSQPNQAERDNAANYKLSGYQQLPTSGEAAKTAIKKAIAAGNPVPIGMRIHSNFNDIDEQTAQDYSYRPAGREEGGHETTIIGYNDRGVTVMNSWGADWGNKGTYTLPWDFVNWGDLVEAHAVGRLATGNPVTPPAPAPTVTPTSKPTPTPTMVPTTKPTVTPTAEPTATPTAEPTATPTAEPTVAPTVEPTPAPSPTDDWSWTDWGWDWSWTDWSWSNTDRGRRTWSPFDLLGR